MATATISKRLVQERAQAHQDEQDAVEADRKELDESKQVPAEAESTDPGGDTAS